MSKIRRRRGFGIGALLLGLSLPAALGAQGVAVTGRLTIQERDGRAANDQAQAVVWLTGPAAPAPTPDTLEMATEGKQFVPHIIVAPLGSTVAFPNHDPFNHNVFSLSAERVFDLGLFGRGEAKAVDFPAPGVIRVYCNVHAQMRGLVVVPGSNLFTRPDADGSFRLEHVPPGEYTLHLWHERAKPLEQPLRVGPAAPAPLALTLDARGYRLVQHRDKNGKSYSDRSRRY
jgi:plastocyanin